MKKSLYGIPEDSLFYENEAMPDTWVFTDGLGRRSLTYEEVGAPKSDHTLAMFYWTWHTKETASKGAVNTNELMKKHPDAKNDYNHEAWKNTGHYCFWNEPIYGFYNTEDAFVLRRHAEMLAGAQIDAIFADNTNGGETWRASYEALLDTWKTATEGGVRAPKVSFHLPFAPFPESDAQVRSLYKNVYSNEKWREMCFEWDGKPMILAHNTNFANAEKEEDKKLFDFFTWRAGQPGYVVDKTRAGDWGWLSKSPQALYFPEGENGLNAGRVEQTTVGVAVNHNYKTCEITAMNGEHVIGRSYTPDYPDRYEKEGSEASKYGYHFANQFDYALEKDPRVIFMTGWNEWHAWRQPIPWGGENSMVNNALADQFDNEHSRDLEPTRGELKDHYYYLLVNYARRYKGARPIPTPCGEKAIDLRAPAEQWREITPYYASYAGNTLHRDNTGYGDLIYREDSGRNDIIGAQVARDSDSLFFRVECAEEITAPTDERWMNLYLDLHDGKGGWEGFDFVVAPDRDHALTLYRFTGEGYARTPVCLLDSFLDGRYLTVQVKKSELGITSPDFAVDFAWTDNVCDREDRTRFTGDILQFYTTGDVAPGGRFRYRYEVK